MTSPAAPKRPLGTAAFQALVETAAQGLAVQRQTAQYALQLGVIPSKLLAYAQGTLDAAGKVEVQSMMLHSPWAVNRIVALTKAARDSGSLGASLLSLKRPADPKDWGIPKSGDPDTDFAALLNLV